MSESENRDTKSMTSWPRKTLLSRTKPVDPSVTEICQQLTNVISQQTALTEKLIGAYRETKEIGQINSLPMPYVDTSRYSPIQDSFDESNKSIINGMKIPSADSSFDTDFVLQLGAKKDTPGVESLSSLASTVDTIKCYNSTAANQIRGLLTGQMNQESLQNSLSQIYGILNFISMQCGNCKTGLNELERVLQSQHSKSNSMQTNQESKSTQTYTSDVDTGESDPDDKDSGLESNPGRPSESAYSNEDFQLCTEYEDLMQAPILCEEEEVKKSPSFLKDRKNSCPGELYERQRNRFKPISKGISEAMPNATPEKEIDLETVGEDNTLTSSPHTPEVFAASNCSENSVQSLPMQESMERDITRLKAPKLNKLQRARTICEYSSRIFEFEQEDELVSLNKTHSPLDEKQDEKDFANLENQVNMIKLHASTNTYSSKSRKDSLQSLVFGTRKQISTEINSLVNKLTTQKRRKITPDESTAIEETTKILMERIDHLMKVSQHFGATLHETSHSDEKEILINFIEMVKMLQRHSSIPIATTFSCTLQRADSLASSGDNDKRPLSPTPVRCSVKSLESTYERGFDEGVKYVQDSLKEDINKNSDYVNKFYRVSEVMKTVLHSEMENRYKFFLASGVYLFCILFVSVILNLFV